MKKKMNNQKIVMKKKKKKIVEEDLVEIKIYNLLNKQMFQKNIKMIYYSNIKIKIKY